MTFQGIYCDKSLRDVFQRIRLLSKAMSSSTRPVTRLLHAGALSFWLVGADLRCVSLNGKEIFQRIYFAVRDAQWRTVSLMIQRSEVVNSNDGFTVVIELASNDPLIQYRVRLSLNGTADGHLHLRCTGVAENSFARMRMGWCIHHPQHLVGTSLKVGHDAGADDHLQLPQLLEPWLVATAMRWLETGPDDARLRLRFSGEHFEMEDQRNYGDASFKTYGTLSALPRPVEVQAGEELQQSLTIEPCAPSVPALPLAQHPTPPRIVRLQVSDEVHPCARIGHLETTEDTSSAGPESHRLVHLDFTTAWRAQLAAAEIARARDGAPTVITVFAEQLTPVNAAALAQHLPPDSEIQVQDDLHGQALARVRAAVSPETLVGHGSRHHFNDVNRAPRLSSDFLGFAINPLVHADDTWSLLESTSAMAHLVASAKALNARLRIGPVMLPATDVRMQHDIGATWLIGILAHVLPGLDADDALTLAPQSQLLAKPATAVMSALRGTRGLRPLHGTSERVAAVTFDTPRGCRVLLANTDHQPVSVLISGLRHGAEALHLAGWAWAILDG